MAAIPAPTIGTASLVDLEPELFEALDGPTRMAARRHALVRAVRLQPGAWSPSAVNGGTRPFAALLSGGVLVSEVVLGTTVAAELIGPGDVIDVAPHDEELLPAVHRWSVAEPVTIAVLDAHLLPVMRAWPSVAAALTARAAGRARRLEVQRAISQLPRVEERLLALFGHLAERFGRMASEGIVVPVALTHQMLGRLVGARRPTVSLALKELAEHGTLIRRGDGAWLLARGSLEHLAGEVDAAGARPADATSVPLPPSPVRVDRTITVSDVQSLTARCAALKDVTARVRARSQEMVDRSTAVREDLRMGRTGRNGHSPAA